MARQTRQRILDTSLAMFNAQGEPNVTTNHIADELEISPGNLYYHFRNKDDIIEHLFGRYEERIDTALAAPSGRLPGLEDVWLQLHLVFECIWDYRFLYRDLANILSRNRRLRMRFARILKRADEQAHTVMRGLVQAGVMRASADEQSNQHQARDSFQHLSFSLPNQNDRFFNLARQTSARSGGFLDTSRAQHSFRHHEASKG